MVPTMCTDAAPFCVVAASLCNVSFCATCENAGLCDYTCNVCGNIPTTSPTVPPTSSPTLSPTPLPTPKPTSTPTLSPSPLPTAKPSHVPTYLPTQAPSKVPTSLPTIRPTQVPTPTPTYQPTPNCGVDAGLFQVQMYATGGKGWGGLSYELTNYTGSAQDPIVTSGSLASDQVVGMDYICLVDLCYKFEIVGSSIPSHVISWEISSTNSTSLIVEGTGPTSSAIFCTVSGTIQKQPTLMPTMTQLPTLSPTPSPSSLPLPAPTPVPTSLPTPYPTHTPTYLPTNPPTIVPTSLPTIPPTPSPSMVPTPQPSVSCARGEYMTTSNACEKCPVGRYLNVSYPPWPSECTQCSPGKVAKNLGLTECESCAAGKVALVNQDSCGTCEQGQFTFNQSYCVNCPLGYYAPTAQDDACIYCDAGSATKKEIKANLCDSCDAGEYSPGGATNCSVCPAGKYSGSRAETCIDCLVGKYAPTIGSSSCDDCENGRYSASTSSKNCTECEIGKFQKSTGQTTCDYCLPGQYAEVEGLPFCTKCSAGFVANGTGNQNCTACAPGQFQQYGGLESCDDCIAGQFTEEAGQAFCSSCTRKKGDGYNSVAGSSGCYLCLEGYYWGIEKRRDAYGCLKCPDNAYCAAGVEAGDQFQPQPLAGYWIDRAAAFHDNTLVGETYSCPRPSVCNREEILNISTDDGGRRRLAITADCALIENYNSSKCSTEAACTVGSTGALCGACLTNWRFSSVSQQCEECGSVMGWVEAFTILAVAVVVAAILFTLRSGEVSVPLSMQPYLGETFQIPLIGILYHVESGTIKVTWSTFQIIQSVSFNLNVTYPDPYQSIVGFLSFFEMDFLSMDCFQGGYLLTVMLSSIAPALLALFCWIIFCMRFALNAFQTTKDMWNQHIHASLLIIYIFVPPVSNKQFKALDCQDLADGQSYLRADTSVDCNSQDYKNFVIADAVLIAIYQSLPLLYVALLFRVRHKLNPPAANKELALQIRDHDESLHSISFLFADYKPSMWFFEITDLYRRIIFVSLIPLMGNANATKAYIGCVLSLLSTIYFRELSPFRVEFTNFLAVVAQYVILLAFMAALIIDSDSLSNFGLSPFSLGAILAGSNLLVVMMAMHLAWNRYSESKKNQQEQHAKILKIEWAAEFSKNKFRTTLQYVIERSVPSSHVLCYYYTSLKQAKECIRLSNIPATADENGIIISLDGPMDIDGSDGSLIFMNELAQSWEAVICLSLPKAHLFPLLTYNGGENRLRIIHSDVLHAMGTFVPQKAKGGAAGLSSVRRTPGSVPGRNSVSEGVALDGQEGEEVNANVENDEERGENVGVIGTKAKRGSELAGGGKKDAQQASKIASANLLTLHMRGALRAYQLKNDDDCSSPALPPTSMLKAPFRLHYDPELCELNRVKTCMEFADQMEEIRNQCAEEGTVPLYHYTSEGVAPYIFEGGFRMSTQGQGDGGVYFSTLGPSSYELGSEEYEENIIIDCFGKERLEEYRGKHKLDVVFVYGINPKIVEQAPGGRKNAKMISKALFETFSTTKQGSYYARPDFIKGNFLIDGTSEYPMGRKKALEALLLERKLDRNVQQQLENYEKIMEKNAALVTIAPQAGAMGSYANMQLPPTPTGNGGRGSFDKKASSFDGDRDALSSVEEGLDVTTGNSKGLKATTSSSRSGVRDAKGSMIEMRRLEEANRRAAAAEEVASEAGETEEEYMVAQ